ncbi:hypothetical protein BDN72DRAFT_410886 [Pluteus cervinus]|uniref:Uncharacterized protein n=1 Tax=Pluteus cervinus TaxID=181527 RepID=A0ACD3B1J0_9AGAR|nr:hypothetical protein BDN72DRAFT_410886 [Pluteus cervinus]
MMHTTNPLLPGCAEDWNIASVDGQTWEWGDTVRDRGDLDTACSAVPIRHVLKSWLQKAVVHFVLHIPKDEESLSDWKDTKFMAQVFLDGELLDEGGEYMLPVIRRGAKTVVRWDLGAFQVPAECDSFTLAITTPMQYCIFEFLIFRPLDEWMISTSAWLAP